MWHTSLPPAGALRTRAGRGRSGPLASAAMSGRLSRTPTVVVSRRAAPGADGAVADWLEAIVAAARTAPGFEGAQVQPPDDTHPGEWVVVYRFATADDLQGWLGSPVRQRHLEDGSRLFVGAPREQVVAVPVEPEPVTAVSSVRVRPGSQAAVEAHHRRVLRALQRQPGFQRAELLHPVEGEQEETVTVMVFDDRDALQRWLDSPVRAILLADLDPLVESARAVNVLGGWAGWFAPGGGGDPGPRRWKQALTILGALFPVSLAIAVVRGALLPDLPFVWTVLLGNAVGVALLTWAVMPPLTRLLAGWLRR